MMAPSNGGSNFDTPRPSSYNLEVEFDGSALLVPTGTGPAIKLMAAGRQIEVTRHLRHTQQLDAHCRLTKQRCPGTGQWFLDSREVQMWINLHGVTLFCPGVPGAGKSVLMASLVEELIARSGKGGGKPRAVACMYDIQTHHYGPERSTGASRCAELLAQLAAAEYLNRTGEPLVSPDSAPVFVDETQALTYLTFCLKKFGRIYLILDGVRGLCSDCNIGDFQLLGNLRRIQRESGSKMNLLITSRSDDRFRFQHFLGRMDKMPNAARNKLFWTLEICASSADLRRYLKLALDTVPLAVVRTDSERLDFQKRVETACAGV